MKGPFLVQGSYVFLNVIPYVTGCGFQQHIQDLNAKDLVSGIARLKGAARNIDMALFRKDPSLSSLNRLEGLPCWVVKR